ncbi:hypothetical protein [Streptomyces globisporus]|uniref:hypothetical protein n=1 Tax=Streptomyces globisporus TaxID=1908 RepID=UPI0004C6F627
MLADPGRLPAPQAVQRHDGTVEVGGRGARHRACDHRDCPGPAVGGSTSLAVVGAYVLAGELARTGGDHERAFPAYERAMAEHVRGSRAGALSAARTLIPASRPEVWGPAQGARLISSLPAGPGRALLRLTAASARLHDSVTVDDYPPPPAAPGGRGGHGGAPRCPGRQ